MPVFDKDDNESVWELPRATDEDYQQIVIPAYIEHGAIPKSELKDGATYYGVCRNADHAVWHADANVFVYDRRKWGYTYSEEINHFEDDDGYDLFIPLKEVTK